MEKILHKLYSETNTGHSILFLDKIKHSKSVVGITNEIFKSEIILLISGI